MQESEGELSLPVLGMHRWNFVMDSGTSLHNCCFGPVLFKLSELEQGRGFKQSFLLSSEGSWFQQLLLTN